MGRPRKNSAGLVGRAGRQIIELEDLEMEAREMEMAERCNRQICRREIQVFLPTHGIGFIMKKR